MNDIATIGWAQNPWKFESKNFNSFDDFSKSIKDTTSKFSLFIINCSKLKEISIAKEISISNETLRFKDSSNSIGILRNNQKSITKEAGFSNQSLPLFLKELPLDHSQKQIILIGIENYPTIDLLNLVNQYPIVSVLPSKDMSQVEELLNALLLTKRIEDQEQTHQKLIKEEESRQELNYQLLMNELSEQQKQIGEIQGKLISSLQQEKLLHETLLIIMTSQGLGDIERQLQESLKPILGLVHLRILLNKDGTHPQTWSPPAIFFELHEQERSLGRFIIHPMDGQNFNRRELKLLENISEAIALHIPRFLAFEANAALEIEWRTTFDAISEPLILVTENYEVVEANKEARSRMQLSAPFPHPCYQLMFNRSTPCEFCRWGQKSNIEEQIQKAGERWEMSSHPLKDKNRKQKIYVHLYRNKFEQIELENKISTFAQAAEVGIFKASLAHELNNPIGGLLTLAQLQKMDFTLENPIYDLIQEIERQALICRDLIQELLQKVRLESSEEKKL